MAHSHPADLPRRLAFANPWAERFLTLPRLEDSPEFRSARRAACLRRVQAGRDVWQHWAAVLGELVEEAAATPLAATAAALATSDFGGHAFHLAVDFAAQKFPGPALFPRARFRREAYFNATTFERGADFASAVFAQKGAWFEFGCVSAGSVVRRHGLDRAGRVPRHAICRPGRFCGGGVPGRCLGPQRCV